MNIRSLRETDYGQVLSMLQKLHALHVTHRPDLFRATEEALPIEEFRSYLEGGDVYSAAAEGEGGVLEGVCLAVRRSKPSQDPRWHDRDLIYLEALYVPEEYRRRGVGKALVDAVRAQARRHGVRLIEFQVWLMPDGAFDFYRSIGFQPQYCSMTDRFHEEEESTL